MGWTAPMTFFANTVLTAAQLNTFLRDNLNESSTAKAVFPGALFVATGLNSIAARLPAVGTVGASEGTGSAAYTDLATPGPTVTCTTSARAMVFLNAKLTNDSIGNNSHVSVEVSGASSLAAVDLRGLFYRPAVASVSIRMGAMTFFNALTPGNNTFTMKYRASAGTGTFAEREIFVIPL